MAHKEFIRRPPDWRGPYDFTSSDNYTRAAPAATTLSSSNPGSRRARAFERPITPAIQVNRGGGLQANSPCYHRSHIETDKLKSVRFFKLIRGRRHRQTTVLVYRNFMPTGFLPYRSLMPSGCTSTLRSTPRIASPQALKCLFPRTTAKRRRLAAGMPVCNSSLAKMRLVTGLRWRAADAEEEFLSIGKRL